MLVAKRSREAGEQPGAEFDVLLGQNDEPFLEQRDEPVVGPGPRPGDPAAVPGCGAGEFVRQAETSRDGGGVEERCLCRSAVSRAALRLAEREQELTARSLVLQISEFERLQRRRVQPRGFFPCE